MRGVAEKSTLKGRLITLVVAVVLTTIALEAVVRVAMPHWREFHSGRFVDMVTVPGHGRLPIGVPGFKGYFAQNNGDFRVYVSINRFGLRNDDPVEDANGRIWVIGDSMTFGWGVERNQMYSSVIAGTTGQATYNIASPGTNICGYQALLARMPRNLTSRAVVLGLVLENDVGPYDCRAKARDAAAPGKPGNEGITLIGLKGRLIANSALYNFLTVSLKRIEVIREALIGIGLISREHGYQRFFSEDEIDLVATRTAYEVDWMRNMLPQGTRFAVLVVPARFELRDGDPIYRRMRLRLGEELEELGVDVIDLYDDLMAAGFAPTHFAHDGHWSPLGHRLAGEAVAEWLAETEANNRHLRSSGQ